MKGSEHIGGICGYADDKLNFSHEHLQRKVMGICTGSDSGHGGPSNYIGMTCFLMRVHQDLLVFLKNDIKVNSRDPINSAQINISPL